MSEAKSGAKLGRIALLVQDIDGAVRDFSDLFGLEFTQFDIPASNMRVAIGEHGIEFVQMMTSLDEEAYAGGLLSGACIAVEDVEKTREHLESRGHKVIMSIPLQSGRKEYVFEPIHNVPVMIYQECGYFDLIAQ